VAWTSLRSNASIRRVVAGADDRDDVVDVEDRQQQPGDQVQPVGGLGPAELGAPGGDVVAVLQVDVEHLAQAQGPRLALDEGDGVDAEAVLELGRLVELLEQGVGVEAVLDLDDQPGAVGAVGEVLDVVDALQPPGLDAGLDLLDDALGPDEVGQLGDHDALAAGVDLLDPRGRPDAERPAPGRVRVTDPVEPDDLAAAGQVGTGDEPHQVLEAGLRVADQVPQRLHDLDQVVRGAVRGHADRDAGGAVDEQVRERGRQHRRLDVLAVVVGAEVDGVGVEVGRHGQRRRRHPALGVPHRRRAVVERAEVPVPVDQGQPHRPRLRGADQGVVDRAVAVRVVLAHHLPDDARALHVRAVGPDAHLLHRVEDPALHGLQPVAGVGQRAGVDDRVRVLQEARLHLRGDVDVEDALGEVVLGRT
jgi:hypothetical protein